MINIELLSNIKILIQPSASIYVIIRQTFASVDAGVQMFAFIIIHASEHEF